MTKMSKIPRGGRFSARESNQRTQREKEWLEKLPRGMEARAAMFSTGLGGCGD
jgi:hypothetical protein